MTSHRNVTFLLLGLHPIQETVLCFVVSQEEIREGGIPDSFQICQTLLQNGWRSACFYQTHW